MKFKKEGSIFLNTHFRFVRTSVHLLPNDNSEAGFCTKYLSKAFSLKDFIFLFFQKKEEEFLQELKELEKEVKDDEVV